MRCPACDEPHRYCPDCICVPVRVCGMLLCVFVCTCVRACGMLLCVCLCVPVCAHVACFLFMCACVCECGKLLCVFVCACVHARGMLLRMCGNVSCVRWTSVTFTRFQPASAGLLHWMRSAAPYAVQHRCPTVSSLAPVGPAGRQVLLGREGKDTVAQHCSCASSSCPHAGTAEGACF